jgi:hypothetical protein
MTDENKVREHMSLVNAYARAWSEPLNMAGAEFGEVEASFRAALAARPVDGVAVPEGWINVDWLANVIRQADGSNMLGAGALAEKIVELLAATPATHEQRTLSADEHQVMRAAVLSSGTLVAKGRLVEPPAAAVPTVDAGQGEGPDSYESIWNALQRISTVAAMLPTFTVDHEGGIEAFTQNIVDAINRLAALSSTAPVQQEKGEALHTFINAAAGEGLVLDGVDAADLYVALFPERYAKAVANLDPGTGGQNG